MTFVTLVNGGTDSWTVSAETDTASFSVTVPAGGTMQIPAQSVEFTSAQVPVSVPTLYLRGVQPVALPPVLSAKDIFGPAALLCGLVAGLVFWQNVSPLKR